MPKPLALLLLALSSCVPSVEAGETFTPYSCEGVTPAPQLARVDPAIVAPWRELADAKVADAAWVARVQAQANAPLPHLGTEERVRLQHQLLRVAERLDRQRRAMPWRGFAAGHASVVALAQRIAPTAFELAALGERSRPAVHAILGPASGITERATQTCGEGNGIHAMYAGGLLAYRPLRAGTTRALVSQLVAFDTAGKPHVTPLVDTMELRLGDEVSSPACVVQAGDDGVLHTAARAEIHEHQPFVVRRGDGVGCVSCHNTPNAMHARDLGPLEVGKVDTARDAQVDRLANGLWKRLNEQR